MSKPGHCPTASSEIIHPGTFTQHHCMKTPKSSSLRDTAALNIMLPFSLLEQTQNRITDYIRLACKAITLRTRRRAPLGPGRCQDDAIQALGLCHEGGTCAVSLHVAAKRSPYRHRNPVHLKLFPTIREYQYTHNIRKQT